LAIVEAQTFTTLEVGRPLCCQSNGVKTNGVTGAVYCQQNSIFQQEANYEAKDYNLCWDALSSFWQAYCIM